MVVCCAAQALVCSLLLSGMAVGQTIAPPRIRHEDPSPRPAPAELPTLQRVLKQFDFEEAERFNTAFPASFYRHIAPGQGFPPFGQMRLTDSVAASGKWSFEFTLGGGSMSARVPAGVLPVLPFADYIVTLKVKASGLVHARARLVAWLLDDTGQPVESSHAASALSNSSDRWESLNIEVHGDHERAAHLVVELQVLQPRQFDAAASAIDGPMLEDVSGQVWFDDVVIAHLPRLSLTMAQPGNVAISPQTPRINILLTELSSEPLTARLRVLDLDGRTLFDDSFPAPRGRQIAGIDLPITTCGWYRGVLDISSHDRLARRQTIDFIVLSPPRRTPDASLPQGSSAPTSSLAVILPSTSTAGLPLVPELVARLGTRTAVLPVWNRELTLQGAPQRMAVMREVIERLLRRQTTLVFAIDEVPDELGRAIGVDSTGVFEMLRGDARAWRPYLDELLVNFGLEINRWQIGNARTMSTVSVDQLPAAVDSAVRSLADFVPEPAIIVPWPALRDLHTGPAVPSVNIWVPHQFAPASVGEYALEWAGTSDQPHAQVMATLEPLPASHFSPRQRLADLMLRALHAWRCGVSSVAIEAPWSPDALHLEQVQPDATFGVWHTLAEQLDGRAFVSELPEADGVHCWTLRGRTSDDAALVAWTDQSAGASKSFLRSQLSAGAVEVIDAFGNLSRILPDGDTHAVPLTELPVFIRGVNLELVQFRGALSITPQFIPAAARVNEHTIILRNPWPIAVSGTIRLIDDEQWQLMPTTQDFVMPPSGEVRLPLNIIPHRNIAAGRKTIAADITLTADRVYSLRVQTHMDVGLKNIDLAATWSAVRNAETGRDDLLITNVVTNKGDLPINLDVCLLAPGVSQGRRTIARLGGGETAVRTFRIPDGIAMLAGKSIRVGVEERDGVARLNRVLLISADGASSIAAAPE